MKTRVVALIIMLWLVAACGHGASPTPTPLPPTAAPPPTTSLPGSVTVAVPQGNAPVLDGTLSPGEWDGARLEKLSDGSDLLLMGDGDYLYLGIRSKTVGEKIVASVILDRGEEIAILHSSAALGTALYAPDGDGWQVIQGFTWQVRDTSNSPAAQEARQAFLQRENWLASLSPMGRWGESEFQVAMPAGSLRLAVAFVRPSLSGAPPSWPAGLQDDSGKPELLQGNTPTPLRFSPESWAVVTAPTSTSSLPAPTAVPLAGADTPGSAPISLDNAANVELLRTIEGHSDRVMDLAFSGDGACLASSSMDGTIRLWDIRSGQEVHAFPKGVNEAVTNSFVFSPDGGLLASANAIWDVESRQVLHTLERGSLRSVAFSPDGSLLAVAHFDQGIRLWDVASGEAVRTFDRLAGEMDNAVFSLAFSPDGALLAAGGLGGKVRLWDVASGHLTATLEYSGEREGAHDVAFSPDGRLLAAGGTDSTVRLWDVGSRQMVRTMRLPDGLFSVAFSPDGTILATAGGMGGVRLWDVESGTMLHILPHRDELMAVAFSPDGTLLASAGYDHQIYLWGVPH